MNKIAIIGAGGLGRETLALLTQINMHHATWEPIGFFDDRIATGSWVGKAPVLGKIDEIKHTDDTWFVLAIGSPSGKQSIAARINPAVKFATLIHPAAVIGDPESVVWGAGCVFAAGAKATTDIVFGNHVLINLNATIGHDTKIGNYCSIMPGANIAGHTKLEEGVLIGSGASVINQSTIGHHTKVGAGAVVTGDIPHHATAVGVPARIVKK